MSSVCYAVDMSVILGPVSPYLHVYSPLWRTEKSKFNLTLVVRGEAFGKLSRLNEVIRVNPPRLNSGNFIRRQKQTSCLACGASCYLNVRRASPEVAHWPGIFWPSTKANLFLFKLLIFGTVLLASEIGL